MKTGYLYIVLSTIFFSSMEIALKIVATHYNPMQLNFLRFLIGALILLPLALRQLHQHHVRLQRHHALFFLLSGFLCVVVSMTFFQLAIMYSKASIVAILFSCNAVFVIPFAYFFLKEKLTWVHIAALAVSVIGMLCIVNPRNLHNVTGIIFSLLSAITFALYGIYGRRGCTHYHYNGIVLSCFSFLAGSLELLVLILISNIPVIAASLSAAGLDIFAHMPVVAGVTWSTLPSLIYLGVFVTGLGYSFYSMAMEQTSAATASIVFYIKPALAPILALLILGESMTEHVMVGIVLIVVGSCITFLGGNQKFCVHVHDWMAAHGYRHGREVLHHSK
jgi:drug/metabolite transporter (DMT)-like permease